MCLLQKETIRSGILLPVRASEGNIDVLATYRRPYILKVPPGWLRHKCASIDSFLTVEFCLPDFLFLNIIKLLNLSVVLGSNRSTGHSEFPISHKWKGWGG